ncbi:MAG TPA: MFS transporter, partial [Candidatus Limnocylindrales bacterium]
AAAAADRDATVDPRAPNRLLNRGLIAALVINAGGYFAGGTYEVIWSLFLQHLGAGLDLIGLTFAMFGLPVLLLSPFAGRLVDRRGSLAFIVVGSILPAIIGIAYTQISNPLLAVPLILIEATGFAMLNPALYAIVAANSPVGRSSTAQGVFGAAGTVGFIVASLIAGVLAGTNIVYPMYVFSAVLVTSLVVGLVIGGRRLQGRVVQGS